MNAPISSGRPLSLFLMVLLLGAALLAGCGGGDEPTADSTPAPGSLVPQGAADAGADSAAADTTGAAGASAEVPDQAADAAATAEPVATLKPAGTSAREETASAAARRSPALQPSGGTFSLQVGSFSRSDYADALVKKVRDAGYDAAVEVATLGGQTYHRVVIGDLADRGEAERIGEKLRAELGVSYLVRQ